MDVLLEEFEKRYTGNPADTEMICEAIAKDWNLDPEVVKDWIYTHRYEEEV